jgi:hypothetical protein
MDGLTPEGAPDDMCRVLRLRDVCRLPAIQPFSNPTIQQSIHNRQDYGLIITPIFNLKSC